MMTKAQQFEAFVDHLGLRYFHGREFTPYWSRTRMLRNGTVVRNSIPHESLWPNIIPTLWVLDEVRHRAGVPIGLNSTYRSPAYNTAVGGEPDSFHMRFMAIDFSARDATPETLHGIVNSLRGTVFRIGNTEYRHAGGLGIYRTFVHVDCRAKLADWDMR